MTALKHPALLLTFCSISFISCSNQAPLKQAQQRKASLKPNAETSLNGYYEARLWDFLPTGISDTRSRNGDRTKLTILKDQKVIKISLVKNGVEIDHHNASYINQGPSIQFSKRSHIGGKPPLLWIYQPGHEVIAINKSNRLLLFHTETEQYWLGPIPFSTRGTGRVKTLVATKYN